MKIVVTGPSYQNQPQSIVDALKALGHEVAYFPMTEFYRGCTYLQRKLYKLGMKSIKSKYNNNVARDFQAFCKENNPDLILVLNGLMICKTILEQVKNYKLILWLWDSAKRNTGFTEIWNYFSKIFVFEHEDMKYLKEKYSINSIYLPLGFDENIYSPKDVKKNIDISFIGIPSVERLTILQRLAEVAKENSLNMKIGGPWYETKYFWKKWRFSRQNKFLVPYIENRNFSSAEAADIYRHSKICLNINVKEHKSLNPRTFEILATRSFQIMNAGQQDYGYLNQAESLVMYEDIDDLIHKIQIYLHDDQARKKFARAGYENVVNNVSMTSLIKNLLTAIDDRR